MFFNLHELDAFMDTDKCVKVTGHCSKVAGFCLWLINYNGIRSVHRFVYSRRQYPRDFRFAISDTGIETTLNLILLQTIVQHYF